MSEGGLLSLQESLVAALNTGVEEEIRSVVLKIAAGVTADPPVFHAVLGALGYHNRLALINRAALEAWPHVQRGEGYSRPAVEAFAARAADHLIYAFLEENPEPPFATAELAQRLERYFPVEADRLQPYLILLTGTKGRPWTAADFEPLSMAALSGLMIEFQGYAQQRDVPFAQSHLVRERMPLYLLDRQAGNLRPRSDVASLFGGASRPLPETPPQPLHALVPDQPSLLLFLQRLLQTAYPQTHAAAMLLKQTALWLDFLAFRDLITPEIARQASNFLPELGQALQPFWREHPDQSIRALA